MFTNKIRYNLYETDLRTLDMLFYSGDRVFEFTVEGQRMVGSLYCRFTGLHFANIYTDKDFELLRACSNGQIIDEESVTETSITTLHGAINNIILDEETAAKVIAYGEDINSLTDDNVDRTAIKNKVSQKQFDTMLKIYTDAGYEILGITTDLPEDIEVLSYYGNATTEYIFRILLNRAYSIIPKKPTVEEGRGQTNIINDSKAVNVKRINRLIYERKEVISDELVAHYCAYAINDDGTLGSLFMRRGIDMDTLSPDIIYYPDLIINQTGEEEVYYEIERRCEGVDLIKRDCPTIIIDGAYITGRSFEFKGNEDALFDTVRDSSVHSGLLWSYLFQMHSPLRVGGFKRDVIEEALDLYEDRTCFGEIVDGVHNMKVEKYYAKYNNLVNMDRLELIKYFKDLMGDVPMFIMVYINTNINLNKYGNWLVIQNKVDCIIKKKEVITNGL